MELKKASDRNLIQELSERLIKKQEDYLLIQLAEVNKKLQEAESIKSNFISNVTNEIINPFTSIIGLSKNIMSMEGNNMDRAKSMASLIQSEAYDLDFQLKNIFAAAKFEAGQLTPEYTKVDICPLLNNIIDIYHYKADQKQIKIQLCQKIKTDNKNKLWFITDPDKLRLIISNLLNNSIKYSNVADKIIIEAAIVKNELKIIVKDYGIGIDQQNMKIIFDRFKRANLEINSLIRGHGLGLSVVKASLDILGGKIDVKSKPKQGTKAEISIPAPEGIRNIDMFSADSDEVFFGENELF
ncbi:MAG: HAMP domain-containing histidine kinase [Bacteroidales bacterium]|nr:HAMP domain-containing histidine kinase [Bacteroidales bacterium]